MKSETIEVLQEKMQNAANRVIEILDSGKPIEQSVEPQLSTGTNDGSTIFKISRKLRRKIRKCKVRNCQLVMMLSSLNLMMKEKSI